MASSLPPPSTASSPSPRSSSLSFQRPIGAKADVEELLYISALHQSSSNIRQDASIISEDIKHYLVSRHGVEVSTGTVEEVILSGFANKGRLDLVELVTLLFIPQFCKIVSEEEERNSNSNMNMNMNTSSNENIGGISDSNDEKEKESQVQTTCPRIIEFVLEMILHDTAGTKEPVELTADLIRSIFHKYGEDIEEDDPVLDEMILVAKGTGSYGVNADEDDEQHQEQHVMLNKESFLRLITSDLKMYNNNETQLSTNFQDVFGDGCQKFGSYNLLPGEEEEGVALNNDESKEVNKFNNSYKKVKTAKGIDYTAGTYLCKYQIVMMWNTFIFGYLGFLLPIALKTQEALLRSCPSFENLESWKRNSKPFLCEIEVSILQWLIIFVTIMVFGFTWIGLESGFGYSLEFKEGKKHFFITIILLALYFGMPFISPFEPDIKWQFYTQIIAYIFASFITFKRFIRDLQSVFPKLMQNEVGTGVRHETFSKKAALNKIKLMQENAIKVISHVEEDSVIKAYFGKALSNFTKLEDRTVNCGGFFWTWKRYKNCEIFFREGVWVSARFLASNLSQMILTTIVLVIGISVTIYMSNNWIPPAKLEMEVMNSLNTFLTSVADREIVQNAVNNLIQRTFNYLLQFLSTLDDAGIFQFDCFALGSYLIERCNEKSSNTTDFACNLFTVQHENLCEALETIYRPLSARTRTTQEVSFDPVFNTTSLRSPFVNYVGQAVSDNVVMQVNRLYPQARYMVTIPTAIATVVAFAVSVALSSFVIPSLISTTLKLRSGVIPTLRNKNFSSFHYEVYNSTKLIGSMFWSNLVASLVVGSTIGFLVFLTLWQVSVPLVQQLFALAIGVCIMILLRFLLTRWFRTSSHRGFYRVKPFSSNIISLMKECLNMGLTVTIALSRALILFLLSEFYVGRLDTPFVANGVGDYGWIDLEPYHKWFLAAILSVEAHRHPYMESLGVMYLMKLKHIGNFNNRVGIKWRTIFVTALMPWMQKYRTNKV